MVVETVKGNLHFFFCTLFVGYRGLLAGPKVAPKTFARFTDLAIDGLAQGASAKTQRQRTRLKMGGGSGRFFS